MTADNRQIIQLAKQGMTADEIAMSLGYTVETVNIVLLQDNKLSAKVDAAAKNKLEEEFKGMEEMAVQGFKLALMGAEMPTSQIAAIKYVLDQRFGLKQPKVNNVLNVISADSFNAMILQARERKKALEEKYTDIEASVMVA